MADYGLLGRLGKGIEGFLGGYDMAKKRKLDEQRLEQEKLKEAKAEQQAQALLELRRRALQLDTRKAGFMEADEGFELAPEAAAEQEQKGFLNDLKGKDLESKINQRQGLLQSPDAAAEKDYKKQKMALELENLRSQINERKRGGGVSGGKAPPGYRFKQDGSLEAIPGGPAAGKVDKQDASVKQTAGLVVQDLGRSLDLLKNNSWSAGPIAGKTGLVAGTPAWQLNSMLDSVKANIGFDKLQAMRAASPTGAGLGAISDKETKILQDTAGKLDVNLPADVLEDNINRLYNQYNDIIHGPGKGPPRKPLSFDAQGAPIDKGNKILKTNEIEWAD